MKPVAVLVTLAATLLLAPGLRAGDLGFLEDFALGGAPGRTRAAALEQLIPGTEDFYFYHALELQHRDRLDEVDALVRPWIEKHGRTARVIEIENRQALLGYASDRRRTLDFLRSRLGLRFDHQREVLGEKPNLPSALAPALIDRETLMKRALDLHGGTTDGFEDRALEWLAARGLGYEARRHLLSRLRWPGLPDLPRLVVDDLNAKQSGGFGSLEIHRLLLQDELDECLRLAPDLLADSSFQNAYLTKLLPPAGIDWRHDAKERAAYLDRLWAFVSRLGPAQNSRKAHVLHHRLIHDRSLGIWDRDRFLAYVRLPRSAPYMNEKYLARDENRRFAANLSEDYASVTQLPPVGDDEPLVHSYLAHFFLAEDTIKPWQPYLSDVYLKRVFAETRLMAGLGNQEALSAMLSPAELQALKERVDIDFDWTTKTVFAAGEPVALDVQVKNVKTLTVKVFALNALNYYQENQHEIDTSVDLDGLVAGEEKTYEIDEPPLRRVARRFELPALAQPGTHVVELVGGGRASRALVRKGRLHHLVRESVAGHVFTILDDANQKVTDARLWFGGRLFEPDAQGAITVPYSTAPQEQHIVLVRGELATLDSFAHEAESYHLEAGIHVEREALLARRKTQVVVRPTLSLNGEPVTLALLEQPALVIAATDREGVSTVQEVKDFPLFEDRESTYELQVPPNLARIAFALKARVPSVSEAKTIDLSDATSFELNGIDASSKIESLLLAHAGGEYALELCGKTGEARGDRPVRLELKHRDFKDPIDVLLQTDASGKIALGRLDGIEWLTAASPTDVTARFPITPDRHTYPAAMHAPAGETLFVPYLGSAAAGKPPRAEVSLLEVRGPTFVADRSDALVLRAGYLEIQGLVPGDYRLWLKESGTRVEIRIAAGQRTDGFVVARDRQLEARTEKPLQIAAIDVAADAVRVRLGGVGPSTRVHVVATRYQPEYPIFADLDVARRPEPAAIDTLPAESAYVVGRDIGDEYRYVLERRHLKPHPGNLLARPTLLLNPWAVRTTATGTQQPEAGEAFGATGRGGLGGRRNLVSRGRKGEGHGPAGGPTPNLDFLREPAVLLANLRPGEDGVVTIARTALGAHHDLYVVAASSDDLVCREVTLPAVPQAPLDLRLADALDARGHFAEQSRVSVVDHELVLPDITTSELETYDTLRRVYGLFVTLSGNATLAEFGFAVEWPHLAPAEKRAKYSQYASHELDFFLSRKDPEFFASVVRPYLANKHAKTFLDHWLLGDDLRAYLEPWAWEQLNTFERILLGQRIPGEPPRTARQLGDQLAAIAPDLEHLDQLFKTALRGRALETSDALGVEKLREEAKEAKNAKRVAERDENEKQEAAAAPPAAAAPAQEPASKPRSQLEVEEALKDQAAMKKADRAEGFLDLERRKAVRQLYRPLETTQEWAENNYYHVPIEQQDASLVAPSAFWLDYARHDGKSPFYSTHLAEAAHSFTEMMLALAVLDLPFEAGKHEATRTGTRLVLTAGSPLIAFHREVLAAGPPQERTPILVTQHYYREGDRYVESAGERTDKLVTGEMLTQAVYGCEVVITNPTSATQKLDVLLQIPRGSLPVGAGRATRTLKVRIEPYHTWTTDYLFYFPGAGTFSHFPVHVSRDEALLAFAEPSELTVVDVAKNVDRASWDYVSQQGTDAEVLSFLREQRLTTLKLDRIAWRMKDRGFFEQATQLLAERHAFEPTLWSYGLLHDVVPAAREFLKHQEAFVRQCGLALASPLLDIDPVARKTYQLLDYWPLVNARAHPMGKTRTILNDRFREQYERFLTVLSYRPALADEDVLCAAGYLLLQDRVDDALAMIAGAHADRLASRLQLDYFDAYLAFSRGDVAHARDVAARYASYPVDRWRNLFGAALAQLDEIDGKGTAVVDPKSRDQAQAQLASTEPALELKVDGDRVEIAYQNVSECRVHYYLMDVELLFSRNPFVSDVGSQFAYIRPNAASTVALDPKGSVQTLVIPDDLRAKNVLVEVSAAGQKRLKTRFSGALAAQVVEPYAQARVTQAATGKPLPGIYVKVYARMDDDTVRFYKDGYTDLRGRFDYGSLSTSDIEHVKRFAILFLSPDLGAVVKEAAPPPR